MDVVGGCNGEEERGSSQYLRKRARLGAFYLRRFKGLSE